MHMVILIMGKIQRPLNWAPCWVKDDVGSGISGIYLWGQYMGTSPGTSTQECNCAVLKLSTSILTANQSTLLDMDKWSLRRLAWSVIVTFNHQEWWWKKIVRSFIFLWLSSRLLLVVNPPPPKKIVLSTPAKFESASAETIGAQKISCTFGKGHVCLRLRCHLAPSTLTCFFSPLPRIKSLTMTRL